jgi:hypothetical protein
LLFAGIAVATSFALFCYRSWYGRIDREHDLEQIPEPVPVGKA